MTPEWNRGRANPVSVITLRAMRDLGLGTNLNAKQKYSLPKASTRGSETEINRVDDILDIEPVDIDSYILEQQAWLRPQIAMESKEG